MKKILVLLMVLFVLPMAMFAEGQQDTASDPVAAAAAEYFADYPGSRIVPATKAFEAIDAGADVLILDIRRADDYAKGHLKGAVNAPWGPELAKAIDWLPDDQPIYVNCYSGQTAGQATAVLNIAGFKVSSIKYGWNLGIAKTEGYEAYVETTANAAPEASGVRIDPAVKAAAQDYFNNLKSDPKAGSNIVAAAKVSSDFADAVIVSIRKPEDYAKGHIEGAINIPFGEGMQASFDQLPKDNKVLVYCYSGQTAGQTVGVLRMMGYDAASIKSGMGTGNTGGSGWGNEGLPVVK
ncbi:MAG: rhodanese-like domain-containing protein [Spirochaetales bacterium]|nr:rhodanese-like domain-containing protein [Spirochaetales bacterium]